MKKIDWDSVWCIVCNVLEQNAGHFHFVKKCCQLSIQYEIERQLAGRKYSPLEKERWIKRQLERRKT